MESRVVVGLLGAALLLAGSLALLPPPAAACGGFFRSEGLAGLGRTTPLPSLAHEQVLLIHDRQKGVEHFVRELAFRAGTETFGFVVPTPGRPHVAKVDRSPFDSLRGRFRFDRPPALSGAGGLGAPGGIGHGLGGGVRVLEVKKVGSFTAFVLQATDEKSLAKWLADNKLVKSKEAEAWLAHYVKMGFYYVAMRYDPPPKKPDDPAGGLGALGSSVAALSASEAAIKAETIHISFPTPLPYYPYLEPERPGDAPLAGARLLEVWHVSDEEVVPVATRVNAAGTRWVRPLREGRRFVQARGALTQALADSKLDALLPEGELVVQTFQDQKSSRAGFADVLFVPRQKRALDASEQQKLAPLLGVLDPSLVGDKP